MGFADRLWGQRARLEHYAARPFARPAFEKAVIAWSNPVTIDPIEWCEPKAEFPEPSPARVVREIAFGTHNVTTAHRALAMQGVKFATPGTIRMATSSS